MTVSAVAPYPLPSLQDTHLFPSAGTPGEGRQGAVFSPPDRGMRSFYHVVTCAEHALFVAQRTFQMSTHAPSLPSPGVPVEGEEDRLKYHAPECDAPPGRIHVKCAAPRYLRPPRHALCGGGSMGGGVLDREGADAILAGLAGGIQCQLGSFDQLGGLFERRAGFRGGNSDRH